MAITNNIPQFDKSKTNLGEAPVDGFKANTLVKSGEVNKAIYDCSLSITALIKALNNTYGTYDGLLASNGQIDSSQSVDEIANTLSLILGLSVEKAEIKNVNGEQKVNAYRLKYNDMPLSLDTINGYGFESFLIKRKNFVCASLSAFNTHFINTHIPITAFYLIEKDVDTTEHNINGGTIAFKASKGDIYPMYKALHKQDGLFWFNFQYDNEQHEQNTISLLGDHTPNPDDKIYFRNYIIPCSATNSETGTIYVVGISKSIMDKGTD